VCQPKPEQNQHEEPADPAKAEIGAGRSVGAWKLIRGRKEYTVLKILE
jgi:hypothetical protein